MPPSEKQRERIREWIELSEDLENGRRDCIECMYRVTPIGQRYERGELAIHVQLRLSRGPTSRYLCAHLEALSRSAAVKLHSGTISESHGESVRREEDGDEESVLLPVVHLLKKGQPPTLCPSVVRLKWSEHSSISRIDAFDPVVELGQTTFDGKVDGVGPFGLLSIRVFERELPHEVIETAPQIVEALPQLQREGFDPFLWDHRHAHDIFAGTRLHLSADTYLVHLPLEQLHRFKLTLESVAMDFRPRELRPRTAEIRSVRHAR